MRIVPNGLPLVCNTLCFTTVSYHCTTVAEEFCDFSSIISVAGDWVKIPNTFKTTSNQGKMQLMHCHHTNDNCNHNIRLLYHLYACDLAKHCTA